MLAAAHDKVDVTLVALAALAAHLRHGQAVQNPLDLLERLSNGEPVQIMHLHGLWVARLVRRMNLFILIAFPQAGKQICRFGPLSLRRRWDGHGRVAAGRSRGRRLRRQQVPLQRRLTEDFEWAQSSPSLSACPLPTRVCTGGVGLPVPLGRARRPEDTTLPAGKTNDVPVEVAKLADHLDILIPEAPSVIHLACSRHKRAPVGCALECQLELGVTLALVVCESGDLEQRALPALRQVRLGGARGCAAGGVRARRGVVQRREDRLEHASLHFTLGSLAQDMLGVVDRHDSRVVDGRRRARRARRAGPAVSPRSRRAVPSSAREARGACLLLTAAHTMLIPRTS